MEYAQNGYVWYRLQYRIRQDGGDHYGLYCGIMYSLKYDNDDYFRGNNYYKSAKMSKTKKEIKFGEWREVLDNKYMDCMSDKDLAAFIVEIDCQKLGCAK